jgi:hypothetical protein
LANLNGLLVWQEPFLLKKLPRTAIWQQFGNNIGHASPMCRRRDAEMHAL